MEKNKNSWCEMSTLPHDIIVDILSRLPIKSLLRFRCVCKAWCNLITNPRFVKLHFNQANENSDNHDLNVILKSGTNLFNLQPFSIDCIDACCDPVKLDLPFEFPNLYMRVVGSCNGLLCGSINWNTIFLWNPSTREYMKIIGSPIRGVFSRQPILGFGCSTTTEQYKVVRIFYSFPDDWRMYSSFLNYSSRKAVKSDVAVYTLGTDSWKELGDVPYNICDRSSGKYMNGALHWMARSRGSDLSLEVIISFDIKDEVFREPDFGKQNFYKTLVVLEGCLCIFCNFRDNHVEIWAMKDYGMRESWTKQFIIGQLPRYLKPLESSKNGQILLLEGKDQELVLYNWKNKMMRDLKIHSISRCNERIAGISAIMVLQIGLQLKLIWGVWSHSKADNGIDRATTRMKEKRSLRDRIK